MRARVTVRLKSSVLDPQGEAIEQALVGLGLPAKNVRVGKIVELDVDDASRLPEMADKLLANPVIEDYSVEVLK